MIAVIRRSYKSLLFIFFRFLLAASCLASQVFLSRAQTTAERAPLATNLHQWGAVTLFHGLPSDRVRAIAGDADGAMWFGTDNGLARYDGRRTQSVAIQGLAEASTTLRVLSLKFDAGGALWVGTDAGAARLLNGEFRAIEETRGTAVNAILTRGTGQAWLATSRGQVLACSANAEGQISTSVVSAETLQSADADAPGALKLTSLATGAAGDTGDAFYAGTHSRGLMAFAGGAAQEINSRPRAYFIEALERDARGDLWLGTRARGQDSGLYLAGEVSRPLKVGANVGTVTALRRAGAEGGMWVGTAERGVFLIRDASVAAHFTFEGTAGGLRSNHVYDIYVDREGVVWFGTDRGVCRYDPRSPRNERLAEDAESNFVRALYRTRGGELLAGTNRGLFVRDEKTAFWRQVAELERESVYALTEDAAGRLLVGSSGGLRVKVDLKRAAPAVEAPSNETTDEAEDDKRETKAEAGETAADAGKALRRDVETPTGAPPVREREKVEKPEGEKKKESARAGGLPVRAIRVLQGVTYLATFGRGVERLDGERRTLVWPTAPDAATELREVTALHAEDTGRLWIGTARAGLYVLENSQVRAAGGAFDKLKGSAIRAVEGTEASGLWVATAGGLYVTDKGGLNEMLTGVEVRAVIADEGRDAPGAWCATAGGGLLRVAFDAHAGRLVSRLDAEQGLSSANAFTLLRVGAEQGDAGAAGGEESLWLGTNRGVVNYTPGASAPSLLPTRILSRRLHQPEEMRAGIELAYPQNNLTLDVAALSSRTFPEQFQYAFALSDAAGREIKRQLSRDAQFLTENLKPGRYRVEARAYTKDLVASDPLAFELTVGRAPFPWTTTMLAVLLLLALVALTWGAVQNRKIARTGRALAEAHHELAGARLNLANEAERERRRIARDLHDQTLADLRSLLLLTDQLAPAAAGGDDHNGAHAEFDPGVFRAEIESVSNEIRRICEDLSPSVLENVGLAAALEWAISNAVAHLPAPQKFEYEFICVEDLDERTEFQTGERMQIYRIAQEAINNVCRHARATRVLLRVELNDEGELLLALEDDGRGFNARERRAQNGRGLSSIRARASLIEAEVVWKRRPGGGTLFLLRKAKAARDTQPV